MNPNSKTALSNWNSDQVLDWFESSELQNAKQINNVFIEEDTTGKQLANLKTPEEVVNKFKIRKKVAKKLLKLIQNIKDEDEKNHPVSHDKSDNDEDDGQDESESERKSMDHDDCLSDAHDDDNDDDDFDDYPHKKKSEGESERKSFDDDESDGDDDNSDNDDTSDDNDDDNDDGDDESKTIPISSSSRKRKNEGCVVRQKASRVDDIENWRVHDVCLWVSSLENGKLRLYSKFFGQCGITGKKLSSFDGKFWNKFFQNDEKAKTAFFEAKKVLFKNGPTKKQQKIIFERRKSAGIPSLETLKDILNRDDSDFQRYPHEEKKIED